MKRLTQGFQMALGVGAVILYFTLLRLESPVFRYAVDPWFDAIQKYKRKRLS